MPTYLYLTAHGRPNEIDYSPIKGCSQLRINQLLTIYQGVHIIYLIAGTAVDKNPWFH